MNTPIERALIVAFRQMPESAQSMIYQLAVSYAASQAAQRALDAPPATVASLALVSSNGVSR